MTTKYQCEEILVYSSELPVLRGGLYNLIFLLLLIFLIYANQIMSALSMTVMVRLVVFVVCVLVSLILYSHCVTKLSVESAGNLVIVSPISKRSIIVSEIRKTEIFGIPASASIFVLLKIENARLPKWFFLLALSTNCGSYRDTKSKLTQIFQAQARD